MLHNYSHTVHKYRERMTEGQIEHTETVCGVNLHCYFSVKLQELVNGSWKSKKEETFLIINYALAVTH